MRATEQLRQMLDERGVEWVDTGDGSTLIPEQAATNVAWDVNVWPSGKDMGDCLWVQNRHPLTPEQAIAATVGNERLAFLEEKVKLQGEYIDKLTKEKSVLFAQGCESATRHAAQIDAMQKKLDAATVSDADTSRWHELFGTPERAAKTVSAMCSHGIWSCDGCPLFDEGVEHCESELGDTPSLLEWLRGDA